MIDLIGTYDELKSYNITQHFFFLILANKMSSNIPTYNIAILGGARTGKSLFIKRLLGKSFERNYIKMDGKVTNLTLQTWKGSIKLRLYTCRDLSEEHVKGVKIDHIILMFNVISVSSLLHVQLKLKELERSRMPHTLCCVMTDLISTRRVKSICDSMDLIHNVQCIPISFKSISDHRLLLLSALKPLLNDDNLALM
jgi:hypothetical protein